MCYGGRMVYRPLKRSPDAHPIGKVVESILRRYRPQAGEAFSQIWDVWEKAVGHGIAAQARPAAFRNGVLVVHASNSVWLQQLQFLRPEIIAKLNDHCGRDVVRELKLKIGVL